ncbi:NUDIX domain-containing protein [Streptomyces cellulosae]
MQHSAVTCLTSGNANDSARRHCQADPMRTPGRAARVAVLDPAGSVFLFRYDNPEVGVHWAMPGGGTEPGESPLQAARREVWEETGWTDLVIEDGVLCLWEHDFTRAGVPVRQHEHIYLAHGPRREPAGNRPGTGRGPHGRARGGQDRAVAVVVAVRTRRRPRAVVAAAAAGTAGRGAEVGRSCHPGRPRLRPERAGRPGRGRLRRRGPRRHASG